jgi:hypothetical protein
MRIHIGPYSRDDDTPREVSVELHPYDTWNLDHTLALIIAPALRRFRDETCSFPFAFECADDPTGDRGLEGWRAALDKMIASFESMYIEYEVAPILSKEERASRAVIRQEGFDLFARHYTDLWN